MKTKGFINFILMLGLLMAATSGLANTIDAVRSPFSYGDAGELTAYTLPDSYLSSYVASAVIGGGFQTFSAQANLYFTYGTTYQLVLSQFDSEGHALTEGAAFLYYDFAKGILPGYDTNTTDAYTRTMDAGELQSAIWTLQGYALPGTQYLPGGPGNPFYDLASTTLGTNLTAANNGLFDVDIAQLWNDNEPAQALLVLPVPDTFSTSAMLIPVLACMAFAAAKPGNVRRRSS